MKRSPKILFISYAFYPQVGGIEVNSVILSEYFHRFGAEIKLITMVAEIGEKKFPFPIIRKPDLQQLFKLHKWADLVFENNPSLRLSWPKLFFRKKNVIAIRTRISREDGTMMIQDRLKLFMLRKACAVISVSFRVSKEFYKEAVVIHNPYRADTFKITNITRPSLSFVFVGRLVSEKGVDLAISAIHQLSKNHNLTPTLKIIGSGPEKENLEKMVNDYNLTEQITFLGAKFEDDLNYEMNSCRYILVPSSNEAFGNVAIEGMASGCLPFVSNAGGLPEAVGDAGILFSSKSVDNLVEKIMEIIENPNLEHKYRQKMSKHLLNHEPQVVSKKYWDIILNCTGLKSKNRDS